MSRPEPKAGEWLRQQIDELGALRNASVRDPQFKAWRQNTLTFIQRIWPGDTSKSERFRRVPFTPPSTRHDPRTAREYYERGCGEALEYLNSLLASLGDLAAIAAAPAADRHPESFEGDFPEVDLGDGPSSPPVGAAPPAALDERPAGHVVSSPSSRGQGPPELPPSAGRPTAPGSSGDFLASAAFLDPEAESPGNLPPEGAKPLPLRPLTGTPARGDENAAASRISVRGTKPRGDADPPRSNPLQDFFGVARREAAPGEAARRDAARAEAARGETARGDAARADAARAETSQPPAARSETAATDAERRDTTASPKNGKSKKAKSSKPRLKDMLGLSSLEHEPAATPVPPVIPEAQAADRRPEPLRSEPEAAVPREPESSHRPLRDVPEFDAPAPPARVEPVPSADIESPARLGESPKNPLPLPRLEIEPDRDIPRAPDDAPEFRDEVESSADWLLPEFMTPTEPSPSQREETPAVLRDEHEALPASHVESLPSTAPNDARKSEPSRATAPESSAAPLAPADRPAQDEDSGQAARVTAEFLDKSPVLSSAPRPVNRRAASPQAAHAEPPARSLHGTAAGRLLAIAAEVDRLGVPEGHRARARAALMDLARQLDDQDVAWDVLREAIHFVMEFPPLARRTLPLLLPFLDLAA